MNTNGHYIVYRDPYGEIRSLWCEHCLMTVNPSHFRKRGDRSGLPKYNRARAYMVKHLHEMHRDALVQRTEEAGRC